MTQESRFVRFCISGLERMYDPSTHLFSTSYREAGGTMVHIRHPHDDHMYTMNCLLGLSRARAGGSEVFVDIEAAYRHAARGVSDHGDCVENLAATVWTGRCLGTEVPREALSFLSRAVDGGSAARRLTAQGLAWAMAAYLAGGEEDQEKATALSRLAVEHYVHPGSGLVRHTIAGVRKDWASFAASCYMSYALLLLAEATGDAGARGNGLRIARSLVRLQGPQGQWPWFYHVPSGRVADYYPVYSVHQHAMAPFFLLPAIDGGYEEFREPLARGFRWILGQNELGLSMVEPERRVIWRCLMRPGSFPRLRRAARAARAAHGGALPRIEDGSALLVNWECRSYELGWALWAFGGRNDFKNILDDSGIPWG